MYEIDIVVECKCGNVLSQIESSDGVVTVKPCEDCLNEQYDDGFEDGQDSLEDDEDDA